MSERAQKIIAENTARHARGEDAAYLDLGNCGLTELPDLSHMHWLETLIVSNGWRDEEQNKWISSQNTGPKNNIVQPPAHPLPDSLRILIFGNVENETWPIDNWFFLENLTGLTTLDLSSNQISNISFLENLTGLASLDLSWNQISDARFLENLTGLTSLDLWNNQISDVRFLENLTGLTSLDLSGNQISDGLFLENLMGLTSLNLSGNQISDWRFLENLTGLTSLYLSANEISDVRFLENLTRLTSLNLSGNQIRDGRFLKNLTGLTSLDLSGNEISDGRFLENLTGLTSLNLWNNQISDGNFLENLTELTSLDLSHNQISDGRFLEKLTGLTSLDLISNKISDGQFLGKLTGLTSLELSSNKISDWRFLENLTGLTSLYLRSNKISDACFLEKLTSLTSLSLSSNQVSDAHFLEKLTGLDWLDLSDNQISDITPIKKLTLLNELTLQGNPVRDIPRALLEGDDCLENVKAWWAETENPDETKRNRHIKLMLNGNGNAGKSTLFHALRDGKCEKEMDSTHGILLDTWACPMQPPVEFVIWDFGGQEIYQGTHRLFMASEAIQLLLIEPEKEAAANDKATTPDRITGEATREQPLQYWIETTRELSPDSELMVVQNKKDLHPERYHPAYLAAAAEDVDYYHVSARRGDSIPLLQAAIHDKAQKLHDYGMLMPRSWVAARQYFLDNLQKPLAERERLLSKAEFFDRCRDTFGVREMAIPALLQLLHYTGMVYYNEQFLDDTIIADQRWALEAIYKPLDRKSDFYDMLRNDTYGKTRVKSIFRAFGHDYTESDKWLFLHFMRSCGLCFPMLESQGAEKENEDTYYVFPEFLPAEMSDSAQLAWATGAKKVQYFRRKYDYLNYYRIQSFIARLGQKTNMENTWRNGLLIWTPEGNFKVYADYENDAVVVAIEERAQSQWLQKILDEWEGGQAKQAYKDWAYSADGQRYRPVEPRLFSDKATPAFDKANEALPRQAQPSLIKQLPDVRGERPLLLVVSYAKEDREFVEDLKRQLSGLRQEGKIEFWYDQKLDGRAFWDEEIQERFEKADGYLALVSPNYVDDEVKTYIHQKELPMMLQRKAEARIPTYCITVTAVDYGPRLSQFDYFSDRQAIPREEVVKGDFLSRFVQEVIKGKFLKVGLR